MVLSSVALVLMGASIVYICRKSAGEKNRLISIALAFMFGGGVGNMIDRFFNESAIEAGKKVVVDFLEFDFIDFAIFNVADSFICIGSVLFIICIFTGKYSLFEKPKTDNTNEVAKETDQTDQIEDL